MAIQANGPVVEYDVKDDIAYIRLNRPHIGNAMNQEYGDVILEIATVVANHPGCAHCSSPATGRPSASAGTSPPSTRPRPTRWPTR